MKRDMDLVRRILLAVEACDNPWGPQDRLKIEGYSDQMVSYHVKILSEAGLIGAQDVSGMGADGFRWFPGTLTWDGHEFLDAARDDTRWNRAKKLVQDKAGSLMFEALKFALTQGIKGQLFSGP